MIHFYSPKTSSMLAVQNAKRLVRKLAPQQRHEIVQQYVYLKKGSSMQFHTVEELLLHYRISRNVPSKLLSSFHSLFHEVRPGENIDYRINIFLERTKIRKHRTVPDDLYYKIHIVKYPRGGYAGYIANCKQQEKPTLLKEGRYYYYKKSFIPKQSQELISYVNPEPKNNPYTMSAKERFMKQYEVYDFIFQIDGKSLEDQKTVRSNPKIKQDIKWFTVVVDVLSGAYGGIRGEKSHNKTNTFMIIKELCTAILQIFGPTVKVLFMSDGGSEYPGDERDRGFLVTGETCQIINYLTNLGFDRRLTRKKEDNGFVENKNFHIERDCLDDSSIATADIPHFLNFVDQHIERNNIYRPGAKTSFRGKNVTPRENLITRFGQEKADQRLNSIHFGLIEKRHKIPKPFVHHSLFHLFFLMKNYHFIKFLPSISSLYSIMHPKSVDFTKFPNAS